MKIDQLITKPTLQEIKIDSPEIVKNYGEEITFYMMDQVDINTYFEYYRSQGQDESEKLMAVLRKLILNAEGKPIMQTGDSLPIDITLEVLEKINDTLGKSRTKLLTQKIGEPQE